MLSTYGIFRKRQLSTKSPKGSVSTGTYYETLETGNRPQKRHGTSVMKHGMTAPHARTGSPPCHGIYHSSAEYKHFRISYDSDLAISFYMVRILSEGCKNN